MKFLLDSNICIYIIKRKPAHILHKFNAFSVGELGIPAIVAAELLFGVLKTLLETFGVQTLEEPHRPAFIYFGHQSGPGSGAINQPH